MLDFLNILRSTSVKLKIVLVNFIICAWFNVAMTSGRLSFRSDEIDKIYLLTLALLKNLSHVVT